MLDVLLFALVVSCVLLLTLATLTACSMCLVMLKDSIKDLLK